MRSLSMSIIENKTATSKIGSKKLLCWCKIYFTSCTDDSVQCLWDEVKENIRKWKWRKKKLSKFWMDVGNGTNPKTIYDIVQIVEILRVAIHTYIHNNYCKGTKWKFRAKVWTRKWIHDFWHIMGYCNMCWGIFIVSLCETYQHNYASR